MTRSRVVRGGDRHDGLVDELPHREDELAALLGLALARGERTDRSPWRSTSWRAMSVRWISLVPSPMIMSGVSR